MVNDFLKKYQEELISDKIQLKEDMDLLETKIKEEKKFLNLLEESNESYFKEFTPRNLNAKNNQKAEEVRNYLIELNNEMNKKNTKMKFYDGRLVEISSLLTNSDGNNKLNEEIVIESPNNYSSDKDTYAERESNTLNSDLKVALSNIKDLILLDPYRAQIELENIISNI